MRVVIVGAGAVGRTIAENLADGHDVIVVDQDEDIVEELTYEHDVLSIAGDGTELGTLRDAEVGEADMVIACTDSDETNVVVCGATKTESDAFTIARVRRRTLLETWQGSEGAFGVDFMVCTDLLTAQAIFRITGLPAARDVDMFAGGLVRMAEFEISPDSAVAGQTVQEADRYDSLTFAAVFRDDEMLVATGKTMIRDGDRIVVIGSPESITQFANEVAGTIDNGSKDVVIVGASEIGIQAAREFEEHGHRLRMIERDPERAREAAEDLPNTMVLQSDATDTDFLKREHIDEADVLVAALDSDEKNLLAALLAHRVGVERTVAVIENVEYAALFETVGVDVVINPREETAEEIVRFTRAARTEKVAMLEHDRAEVIEIEVGPGSTLTGKPIAEATNDLPDGVVIGAISRGGDLITPRGTTIVKPGDHVVVFVDAGILDEVIDLL
ncbi:potassium transporter peripheral membrane component [Halovivax asiaticus JCM 14624]|uniref:Potassium transporter peripheral membrane component n=1 Tax=Halovivax asiaticus JCM 14624 TaxID=1227490 RepID=M0BCA4_9EURY|nr:Trk system potassium transporter TrkA [Halovivax asiaticus]ELZ08460.1 potassium transporter peripheral membrane component [Halovivax asiaticus JCM 14624]